MINFGSLSGSHMFIALSQILVLPIVARYLDVADFGDVALAMTVTLFAQLLSDAGLGRSLIRKGNVDPVEWSSVFWFLTGFGLLLAAALVLIAPLWAQLFGRPMIGQLVSALAIVPFLSALSAVPTAMMERARRFPVIASLRAGAAISGFFAVLLLAPAGAGPWALIAQQIVIALVQCVGALFLGGFRPLSPLRRVPLGDHFGFASSTVGVSLLMTAQRQIPMMLIGYVHGAASLGYYSMSQRIQNLPLQSVGAPFARVAYVHMSAVQKDPDRIGDIYVRGILLMALAILPPMAVLAGVGDTAFSLLLSEAWRPAATIFALAAPGIALETATSHAGVLFQAVNRSGLRLRMVAERTCLRLVLVAAALPFGVNAVAAAVTVAVLLYLPRLWFHVGRVVPLDARAAFFALLGPAVAALLLFATGRWIEAETSGWTTLMLAFVVLVAVWGAAALILRKSLRRAIAAFAD